MITAEEALKIYSDSKERKEIILSDIEREIRGHASSRREFQYDFKDCSIELVEDVLLDLRAVWGYTIKEISSFRVLISF